LLDSPSGPTPPHCWGFEITLRQDTLHSVGLVCTSDQPEAETYTWWQTTQQTDIDPSGANRTHNPSKQAAADPCFRPRGQLHICPSSITFHTSLQDPKSTSYCSRLKSLGTRILLLNSVKASELGATTSGRMLTPSFDKTDLFFRNLKLGEYSIARHGDSINIFRFTFSVRKASKHTHIPLSHRTKTHFDSQHEAELNYYGYSKRASH
jgi:hypothetical protein